MSLTILGQGSAVPAHSIEREESVQLVVDNFCRTDQERRVVPALYRMAGVQRRHSVLLEALGTNNGNGRYRLLHHPSHEGDRGPSVAQRMAEYESSSAPLALRAAETAMTQAATDREAITHLVTVSCSGFCAPGVDIHLIDQLGLRPTVERVHVGFMGCHGALNGLRAANAFAGSDPHARILLCAVELCSVHYHYGWDPEKLVANALFADGAAAIVGGRSTEPATESGAWTVRATGSCLIPNSKEAMTWRIGDNGFEMTLSNAVPSLIESHLRPWVEDWLARQELGLGDVQTWAVHPGGPRILSSVTKALDLGKEDLAVSKEILRDYGNMSSPTILFILDRLRQSGAKTPCVALAVGPGLMAEAVLFN